MGAAQRRKDLRLVQTWVPRPIYEAMCAEGQRTGDSLASIMRRILIAAVVIPPPVSSGDETPFDRSAS